MAQAETLLVDGLNLLGARPDGWWRDRPRAMARLVDRLDRIANELPEEVVIVFDGREHQRVREAETERVGVRFAPGGPDAADKVIAAMVRSHPTPELVLVVSSDKRLRNMVRAAGGESVGAGQFTAAHLGGPG
ncbi:MAG: NYN domain-containing protein [Solirubrobacterales bacterium]